MSRGLRVSTRAVKSGIHTRVAFFVNGGRAGELVFADSEWEKFERSLHEGLAQRGFLYQTAGEASEFLTRGAQKRQGIE